MKFILEIYPLPFKKITYGFVEFANLISAEDACEQFDDLKLDFVQIKVRLSEKTKNQLKLKKKESNNKSILLELPKKKALVKDLRENKEIVEDFTKACLETENITFPQKCEIVKTAPELADLKTLETTIIRYFKPTCEKDNWEVDIDLSKGKRLTTEQNDKFFNLQLTKRQPQKQKTEKSFSNCK